MQRDMILTAIAKARRGIAQCLDIMTQLPTVNVAEDKVFQRRFNGFFRISDLKKVDFILWQTRAPA